MDGSGNGVDWYECSVRWQRTDRRAIVAWIARDEKSGVGVIVYTQPDFVPKHGASNVADAYDQVFRYTISGFGIGEAPTLSQAMTQAVLFASSADPSKSESRFKTEREWLKAITVVGTHMI